jgi:RNA polymerase sigma factor (sigma-70 family)
VEQFTPLVVWIAKRYQTLGVPLEDLIQEGHAGLLEAINKFDFTRRTVLSTYAYYWIRGRVARLIQKQGPIRVPAAKAQLMYELVSALDRFRRELGAEPTLAQLAAALSVEEKEIAELARLARRTLDVDDAASLVGEETFFPEERGGTYSEAEVAALLEAFAEMRSRIEGARNERLDLAVPPGRPGSAPHVRVLDLARALESLPESEYRVVELVGLERLTKREAAGRLNVHEKTIYNRYKSALAFLVGVLNGERVSPRLRTLEVPLDPSPLETLQACVRRYEEMFRQLETLAAQYPGLPELEVTWIPGETDCRPLLGKAVKRRAQQTRAPSQQLSQLLDMG